MLLKNRLAEDQILSSTSYASLPAAGIKEAANEPAQKQLLVKLYRFYKTVIQNINAGLLTVDLDGEITFANKRAAELLGCEVQELLGKNIRHIFKQSQEAEKFLRLIRLPDRRIHDRETRFVRMNGKDILVNIDASPLKDESNQFEGASILFRDITQVHHLREQVERMERLALLGELSAGIAHEIRNPLAGIKAAAQVLQENYSPDDVPSQLIERIVREVDKANRLLKEFFKFARPTPPKFAYYDIQMIIDSVYLLLAPRLKKRNIKFVEHAEENIPQVYVDETQIEQVILNLFLNAIDAMPAGGTISVNVYKKKLNLLDSEKEKYAISDKELFYVLVEVSDTGVGIPPEQLPKIFNPFFTTKPEGLGLGLSICSRLIEENRGKIDVVSKKGKGTTFIIALPSFIHK